MRKLVFVSILLAIVVVSLGAYTRLTHAGLGCPDWPGCYGLLKVPVTTEQIVAAEQAFPERPVETNKAWNEMIHRYFAGTLGLLILWITVACLRRKEIGFPKKLPLLILAIVTFQAALGMWTVTMKLMPIIVMAHLIGGFTTLCLLFLLY
ncbi:MAG: COX15/CtaA family protein, partial [Pseudoalteromonas shioyasakiensis]